MKRVARRRRRFNTFVRFLSVFCLTLSFVMLTLAALSPYWSDLPGAEFSISETIIGPAYDDDPEATASEARKRIEDAKAIGTVYLTFDDGPGPYTAELLDILAEYGVKATFFVTGAGDDSLIARAYAEGHAIGLHTYSHNYALVYTSVDDFFADLYRVQDRVEDITGYKSYLMRFPGGSSNTVSARYDGGTRIMSRLVDEVEDRGFTYFDWNVASGDTDGTTSASAIVENVTSHFKEGGNSIVLQHDIKSFSVAAVEDIIKYGLKRHYKFDKLTSTSFTAHHGVNN